MSEQQPVQDSLATMQHHREEVMQGLLGVDYDYARDSGLIDQFELNPANGDDSLIHILSGDVRVGSEEQIVPGGFHHEPSAIDDLTYVDRDHIATKKPRETREYREFPYSVYPAHVVVGGFRKMRVLQDPKTGIRKVNPANNGMFPKEYDALAVMRTISQAVENRDRSQDRHADGLITSDARAVMLDGETEMTIRLCLREETGKIVGAFPLTTKGGRLKAKRRLSNREPDVITREEIKKHLGLA